jgi:hypothetical protein
MNNFKTFQPFFNKCKKSAIPILNYIRIESGIATISDIETWVTFSTDLPDGYYDLIMNEPFLIKPLESENVNYPMLPADDLKTGSVVITTGLIVRYAPHVSDDELRPVMGSIHLDDQYIAATDAHQILFEKGYSENVTPNFVANIPVSMALLSRCKASPNEPLTAHAFANYQTENGSRCKDKKGEFITRETNIKFLFCDCTIVSRLVQGAYPNFIDVIPNFDAMGDKLKCIQVTSEFAIEAAKTFKAFKSKFLSISPIEMNIKNVEMGLTKSWPVPETIPYPQRTPDGVLMPVEIKNNTDKDLNEAFALNPVKLATFTTGFKGNIIIGYHEPARAMALWLEPATMPAYRDVSFKKVPQKALPARVPASVKPTPEPIRQEPVKTEPIRNIRPIPTAKDNTPPALFEYSEKSVALFGNTKPIKEQLMAIGGKFNRHLQHLGQPTAGWIFSRKRLDQVLQLIA